MFGNFKYASVLVSVLLSSSSLTLAFSPSRSTCIRALKTDALPTNANALFSNSVQKNEESVSASTSTSKDMPLVPETAAILPGQVVSIRIGDMSNPRKAWKKRRRTGSPILVPCTILGMSKETMIKFNVINLLHRFGKPQENDGVVLSVGAVVKLYKHRLGGNLLEHAKALGYETIVKMFHAIFDDIAFRDTGVKVTRTGAGAKRELVLSSSLSVRLARESAFNAEFIQFRSSEEQADRMVHTGTTFQIEKEKKYQTLTSPDVILPLSAAVRISQADAESGRFQAGMECNAFFHCYDGMGDNGSPLVTCAVDPPRGQIREQMKRRAYVKRQVDAKTSRALEMAHSVEPGLDLSALSVGDGPISATVVTISSRASAVFVDLGVTRTKGKKSGGGTAKVLGMLTFDDMLDNMAEDDSTDEEAALIEASLLEGTDEDEEDDDYDEEDDDDDDVMTVEDLFMDDEEEDDVSDVYSMDDDGNVYMTDPSTGEKTVIGSADGEVDDAEDEDNMFAGMSPEERLRAIGDMLQKEETPKNQSQSSKGKDVKPLTEIREGDKIDVYIRSISAQSGRFMVTLDASTKDHKMKDLKREKQVDKRLSKLAKTMGGEDGMVNILSSVGLELEGVVKAKSKTGDWYYIQPDVEGFPVGVAKSEIDEDLEPGQRAKIRVDGIDESRGQLALTVLEILE